MDTLPNEVLCKIFEMVEDIDFYRFTKLVAKECPLNQKQREMLWRFYFNASPMSEKRMIFNHVRDYMFKNPRASLEEARMYAEQQWKLNQLDVTFMKGWVTIGMIRNHVTPQVRDILTEKMGKYSYTTITTEFISSIYDHFGFDKKVGIFLKMHWENDNLLVMQNSFPNSKFKGIDIIVKWIGKPLFNF